MTNWKRIASMFAFSLSTAILGAACAAKVDEPAPAPAQAQLEEERAASPPFADDHRGERRERCRRHCQESFDECLHHEGEHGRDPGREERRFRCERESRECFERCDHEHDSSAAP